MMRPPYMPPGMLDSPEGLHALNAMITKQATFLAYLNDFWAMAVVMLLLVPGLFLMRKPARAQGAPPAPME